MINCIIDFSSSTASALPKTFLEEPDSKDILHKNCSSEIFYTEMVYLKNPASNNSVFQRKFE